MQVHSVLIGWHLNLTANDRSLTRSRWGNGTFLWLFILAIEKKHFLARATKFRLWFFQEHRVCVCSSLSKWLPDSLLNLGPVSLWGPFLEIQLFKFTVCILRHRDYRFMLSIQFHFHPGRPLLRTCLVPPTAAHSPTPRYSNSCLPPRTQVIVQHPSSLSIREANRGQGWLLKPSKHFIYEFICSQDSVSYPNRGSLTLLQGQCCDHAHILAPPRSFQDIKGFSDGDFMIFMWHSKMYHLILEMINFRETFISQTSHD